jgi:RND family efflux transporter MFP subunit
MTDTTHNRLENERSSELKSVIAFILVIFLLVAAIGVAMLMFKNAPKAEESTRERPLPPVETLAVEIVDFPVEILTQGSIESRRESRIAAELSARVIEISPQLRRGGRVREGDVLVRLEPTDFEAALADARSRVADTELILAQEEARGEQARADWERLGGERTANPLALREPQLAFARARVEAARAAAAMAERNLVRTVIQAPFDAAVREAMVEVGAVTRPGEPVAELFTTDELEIRLPLTLVDYGFLKLRDDGSVESKIQLTATLGGREVCWDAEPVRLDAEIDARTMSAFLIARVLLGADGPPPVGLFVEARVSGDTLGDVAIIPRRALREGGQVFVITPENRLEFRTVDVARTTREHAVIRSGLAAGERLCLTRISAPVNGMEVIDATQTQAKE